MTTQDPLAALRETLRDIYESRDMLHGLNAATSEAIVAEDAAAILLALVKSQPLATTPPAIDPESVVAAMENEGVVTWGDERHRGRFLSVLSDPH